MTKTDYLLSGALALLLALPLNDASAQVALRTPTSPFKEASVKVKAEQSETRQKRLSPKFPLRGLAKEFAARTASGNKSLEVMKVEYQRLKASKTSSSVKKTPRLTTAEGRELWGNVVSQSTWGAYETNYGVYSFNASSPITVTEKALNDNMVATGGGALVDGIYHMIYEVESWGYIFMTHYAFDTNTWEQVAEDDIEDYAMYARETAVAADGTVYGEFYDSDLYNLELGVVDYNTLTRTTIGTLTNSYAALGITRDNKLYGVAADGNLYSIDTKTAKETLVGATGVTIADKWGDYSLQSGEIDYRTNTFYWAAVNADGESALYTVDLATGKATKVADFPANEYICALSIPEPTPADAAPTAVTDAKVEFEGASLTGTVSFTAPTKTYGGDDLTGDLNYYIVVKTDTIAKGKTTAGAAVKADATVKDNGSTRFQIITENSAGQSKAASVTKYVGMDIPEAIGSVKLDADDNTGKMTVTWTVPKAGENGGYVGDLKYNVVRYPDSITVVTETTDTVFTETIESSEIKAYTYGVVAVNGTMKSKETMSNKVVMGPGIIPPYANTFGSKDAFDLMTVIDANNDGCTWSLYTYSDGTGYARYTYSTKNKADDWLLTPPLKLEAGKEYIVSFEAANFQSKYAEKLEVKYGVGSDPTKYEGVILEPTVLQGAAYTTFANSIVPDADGTIKIGFHGISDPYKMYLMLRNITVSEGSAVAAPDSATAITVAPGEKGALEATVSFTLPSKAINGSELASITKVDILRDGVVVGSVTDNLKPGCTASYTDKGAANGKNTYSVRVYNAAGGGRYSSEASTFVGPDKPTVLTADSIKITDNFTSINLSWAPVTEGANGGYVNPDEIWYKIYYPQYDVDGDAQQTAIDSVRGKTTYDVTYDTSDGEQKLVSYCISAKNEVGESNMMQTRSLICGKPYELPFHEVFPGGKRTYDMWVTRTLGSSSWNLVSKTSYDAQGGSAAFDGAGDAAYLSSGKISLDNVVAPKLVFRTKTGKKTNGSITVQVCRPDNTVDSLTTVTYNTMDSTQATPWATTMVSLEKYVNEPYIILQFCGEGTTNDYIYLDDINVRNVFGNDLAAEISMPESAKRGSKTTATVTITNYGANAAEAYYVNLYAEGQLVDTKNVTESLASFESKTFTFDYKPSVFADNDSTVSMYATVELSGDEYTENNTAETSLKLQESTKAAPQSALAFISDDAVYVDWTASALEKAEVTDGFEDYATWSADKFGDWTCADGDKGLTGLVFNGYKYGHQGEAFAFEIWEPEAIFAGCLESNPSYTPHSGNKYAAAVYSNVGGKFVDANNWLISPTLSGDMQTITFYALCQGDAQSIYPETVELLYSTAGASDTAKFVAVDTVTIDKEEWTEVTFDVPADATNFAIHHITTSGGFMFAVDDVTYIAGIGKPVGYNVYRNKELVATVPADTTSYVDAATLADGVYRYAVTAVYDDGESAPVEASPIVVSAINGIDAASNKTYTVYTVDGKLVAAGVKSLSGLKKGVYIVNNKKTVVK